MGNKLKVGEIMTTLQRVWYKLLYACPVTGTFHSYNIMYVENMKNGRN